MVDIICLSPRYNLWIYVLANTMSTMICLVLMLKTLLREVFIRRDVQCLLIWMMIIEVIIWYVQVISCDQVVMIEDQGVICLDYQVMVIKMQSSIVVIKFVSSCFCKRSKCQSIYVEYNTLCHAEFGDVGESLWSNSVSGDDVYHWRGIPSLNRIRFKVPVKC